MAQVVFPLSEEDIGALEAKRRWVREHYEPHARGKYQTLDGKLALLDAILSNNWIEPGETLKLQCLGIAFGDALEQMLGLEWRMVEDEYGRDPALVRPGRHIDHRLPANEYFKAHRSRRGSRCLRVVQVRVQCDPTDSR